MEESVPQNIQNVIQATVDRAIATLLETGLLKGDFKQGKRKSHSRSRSHSKGKKPKGKKKHKKRSSSLSSSSCSDDNGEKNEKCKNRKETEGGEGLERTRSHSRSRSGSRSRSRKYHKRGHNRSPCSHHHHHFHYPACRWTGDESEGPYFRKENHKDKKHGRKHHCTTFHGATAPNDNNDEPKVDGTLTTNFENLEVRDNNLP